MARLLAGLQQLLNNSPPSCEVSGRELTEYAFIMPTSITLPFRLPRLAGIVLIDYTQALEWDIDLPEHIPSALKQKAV